MHRRILAPLLLVLAAAASIAAVFVVHDIEAGGGPLSEPSVVPFFSPGTGVGRDTASVRFTTTQGPERITVRVLDRRGRTVRTLLDGGRVDGSRIVAWDGRDDDGGRLPDGAYTVRITRAGDERVYAPTRPITIDTKAPAAKLDAVNVVDGPGGRRVLRGLVLLDPTATLVATDADGDEIDGLTANRPAPGTPTLVPRANWPRGTELVRFQLPQPDGDVRLVAVDAAGNRTEVAVEAAQ